MLEKMLRRVTERPQQKGASVPPRPPAVSGAGTLATVIVPRSAVERAADPDKAHDLVQAVVNFVNAMMGNGLFTRFEVPARTMQSYHADFYLAQVNNGGHSQFIHNCHGNLDIILTDVRAGLAGMGAQSHLSIFERMADWIAQSTDEAAKQTGFSGGRAPLLDELDKQFYAAENDQPMIPQSARWIAAWPELKSVEDAEYAEALRRTALMNPKRESRLLSRSVAALGRQMTDWFHIGVGMACANGPKTEIKLAIGGGSVMDIEGQKQTAFHVRTNAGVQLCVVTNNHAAAYELIQPDNPPMPALEDVEGMKQAIKDGRLARFRGPSVGRKLSHIDADRIAGLIAMANRYGAPAALDLLLRKAKIDPAGAQVAPMAVESKPGGSIVVWLVAAGGEAMFAHSFPNGGALIRAGDRRPLATVTRIEIDSHAARAEAGAA